MSAPRRFLYQQLFLPSLLIACAATPPKPEAEPTETGSVGEPTLATEPASLGARVIDLEADSVWKVRGEQPGDGLGFSFAAPGDLDGNGTTDIAIGAPFADVAGRIDAGKAYVVLSREHPVDLANVTRGKGGFALWSAVPAGWMGFALAGGDLDHDGHGDLVIGEPFGDGVRSQSGQLHLIRGASQADWKTAKIGRPRSRRWSGMELRDTAGWSLSFPGDVNGDGKQDLAYGGSALAGDHTKLALGTMLFGGSVPTNRGLGRLLDSKGGYLVEDGTLKPRPAGDVDGDGLDDVLWSRRRVTAGGVAGYVSFGREDDGPELLSHGDTAAPIRSPVSGLTSIRSAGKQGLLVTAGDFSVTATGRAYLAPRGGRGSIELAKAKLLFESDDWAPVDGGALGDIDGDGTTELYLTLAGRVGERGAEFRTLVLFAVPDAPIRTIDATETVVPLRLPGEGDETRHMVRPAGDLDGDDIDDFFVGAYWADDRRGRGYIVSGGSKLPLRSPSDLPQLAAVRDDVTPGCTWKFEDEVLFVNGQETRFHQSDGVAVDVFPDDHDSLIVSNATNYLAGWSYPPDGEGLYRVDCDEPKAAELLGKTVGPSRRLRRGGRVRYVYASGDQTISHDLQSQARTVVSRPEFLFQGECWNGGFTDGEIVYGRDVVEHADGELAVLAVQRGGDCGFEADWLAGPVTFEHFEDPRFISQRTPISPPLLATGAGETVFASTGGRCVGVADAPRDRSMWRSDDAGDTWTRVEIPGMKTTTDAVFVDPEDPSHLAVRSLNCVEYSGGADEWPEVGGKTFLSENAGESWTRLRPRKIPKWARGRGETTVEVGRVSLRGTAVGIVVLDDTSSRRSIFDPAPPATVASSGSAPTRCTPALLDGCLSVGRQWALDHDSMDMPRTVVTSGELLGQATLGFACERGSAIACRMRGVFRLSLADRHGQPWTTSVTHGSAVRLLGKACKAGDGPGCKLSRCARESCGACLDPPSDEGWCEELEGEYAVQR
ncbi:MAG: hypothetical protein ACRBN8_01535 [Nannocystales bacterium]